MGDIIRRHGIPFHFYADDTQIYIAFKPNDVASQSQAVARVEACIAEIRYWMSQNYLKLNDDKTELLILSASPGRTQPFTVKVGSDDIAVGPDPPRNLGVYFDAKLCLDKHVKTVNSSINNALFNLGKIRRFLDIDTCKMLVNAGATSRLDYCIRHSQHDAQYPPASSESCCEDYHAHWQIRAYLRRSCCPSLVADPAAHRVQSAAYVFQELTWPSS